jgi:hypothetical protein
MIPTWEKRSARRKTCSSAALYTIHPTYTGLGSKPVLLGERLATNRPSRKPVVPFIHVSFRYGILSISCHKLNVWTTFIFTVTRNLMFTSCQVLSAFAKLQKVTIRFDMSVFLSVCQPTSLSVRPSAWNNSAPTGKIFMKCYVSNDRASLISK